MPEDKDERSPESTKEDLRIANLEIAQNRAQETRMYYGELIKQGFTEFEALQLIKVPYGY